MTLATFAQMALGRRLDRRFRNAIGALTVALAPALALALALAFAPALARAQSVALVVDRSGTVDVVVDAGAPASAQVLAALPAGTRVRMQGTSTITLLYLQTGDEYVLTGPGEAELRTGAPVFDAARMRRKAGTLGRPVRLPAENVTLAGVVMRSGGPRPLHPAGQVIAKPMQLAWSSLLNDARFRVELRDASGNVLMQERTTGLSLMLPTDLALAAGQRYTWSVALADSDAPSAATATFEIADAELRSTASRMKPDASAPFSDRLVYGLWLEQAGATGEARQLWEQLARERPDEPVVMARSRR